MWPLPLDGVLQHHARPGVDTDLVGFGAALYVESVSQPAAAVLGIEALVGNFPRTAGSAIERAWAMLTRTPGASFSPV